MPNEQPLRIARVEVLGLFDDRDVTLRLEETGQLSFVHAPNGAGKTTVLRLIEALYSLDLDYLLTVSFRRLRVMLSDGSVLGVEKGKASRAEQPPIRSSLHDPFRMAPLTFIVGRTEYRLALDPDTPAPQPWSVQRHGRREYRDPQHRWRAAFVEALRDAMRPEVKQSAERLNVRWLGADRLSRDWDEGREERTTVVEANRDELAKRITFALKDYAEFSQSLDRTLAKRLLAPAESSSLGPHQTLQTERELESLQLRLQTLTAELRQRQSENLLIERAAASLRHRAASVDGQEEDETLARLHDLNLRLEVEKLRQQEVEEEAAKIQNRLLETENHLALAKSNIKHQFAEIDAMRSRFVAVGLLDPGDDEVDVELADQVDAEKRQMLVLYLADVARKLERLNPTARRLELFVDLVNDKFDRKRLVIDRDHGYRVLNARGEEVQPNLLSSGEQQILVLFFRLIFSSGPNSVFLIDEPELSLHVQWQETLSDDLMRVGNLSEAQFILATHNPIVVGEHLDQLVGMQVSYQ